MGSTKITVVTAYNACTSSGDTTYYHQQLRILSRLHREQHIATPPNPRHQFILDLQSWLEHLQLEGHQFILAMDANETFDPDVICPKQPLQYDKASLTVNAQHNGKLSTLVSSCDLCLPLATQHETRPFPASHIRGKHQIDYIFVSKLLLPAVQQSGVLAHHSLTRGDHRPYYLDFDPILLFSDPAYNIEPVSIWKLRLQDPHVVQQYITNLHRRLDHHNVFPRLEAIQEVLQKSQWTQATTQEYESLDNIITESMLAAENDLSKRITTTYQWSPRLKQAVQRLRYWQLRLQQVRNQPFAVNQLLKYREVGNILDDEHSLTGEQDIQKARQAAYQNLKELQQQHQTLRDTYLEDLAEAIVLDRSPNLADPTLEAVKVERSEKQLKQLISREKMRKMYRKIGRALNKFGGKGLSRIDVPDASATTEGSGDPDNPKSKKGPWKSLTNPVEIAREVCKVNAKQYHQAHFTPFGSGPVAQLFGRHGDTLASNA